jgi:integrase
MKEENNQAIFEVDKLVKDEFLEKQRHSTRGFYSYILKKIDEWEVKIGKKVYDFNIEDRDEFLLVQFKNGSFWAFQTNLAVIKQYIDFCISQKHIVKHYENRFAMILSKDYEKYVKAVQYISKLENRELQKKLINKQDKLILEFIGIYGMRGRTEDGNTLEELVNLRIKDIDRDNKIIKVLNNDGEDRKIQNVDEYTFDLIEATLKDTFYIFNNGLKKKPNDKGIYEKTERGLQINPTIYVFRTPGKKKIGKTTPNYLSNKIPRLKKWLKKPYLTVTNLYFSAMIEYAKNLKEKNGELTEEDYSDINEIFNFGSDGNKYAHKTKKMVNMYI